MERIFKNAWFLTIIVLSMQVNAQSSKQAINNNIPKIPVGYDAYRMWDKWPQQRIGARAYMRNTYDRRGGNNDFSHFLFANEETHNVTLDVKGTGVLYWFRANHWHGSPWNFVVDGKDNFVQETATSDPVKAIEFFRENERKEAILQKTWTISDTVNAKRIFDITEFIPSAAFPQPLNWTWGNSKGGDLIWTPMPFKKSMRIAYSRTHYGTGYYIYHLFADESNLSQPIRTWDIGQVPDKDVLDLIGRAGTDIAPKNIKKLSGKMKLNKERIVLADIKSSSSQVRAFKLTIPMDKAIDLEQLRLKVTWDNAEYPSIDAPLCLFFGAGTFYNRYEQE